MFKLLALVSLLFVGCQTTATKEARKDAYAVGDCFTDTRPDQVYAGKVIDAGADHYIVSVNGATYVASKDMFEKLPSVAPADCDVLEKGSI